MSKVGMRGLHMPVGTCCVRSKCLPTLSVRTEATKAIDLIHTPSQARMEDIWTLLKQHHHRPPYPRSRQGISLCECQPLPRKGRHSSFPCQFDAPDEDSRHEVKYQLVVDSAVPTPYQVSPYCSGDECMVRPFGQAGRCTGICCVDASLSESVSIN